MAQCIEYVIYLSKAINQSKRLHADGSVELCEACLSFLISADCYPVSISILAFVCPGPICEKCCRCLSCDFVA